MNVLIYDGSGVTSLQKPLLNALKFLLRNYDVMLVSESVINSNPWEETTKLFVMPGGRDLQFLSALDPLGIQKLKRYVENGGGYLGLCAGAYFACTEIEFELHRPFYEVVGPRPLRFVPAKAVGSVAPKFDYGTELGATAMKIERHDGSALHVYVNGGPCFKLHDNADVLARYENQEPAIVKTKVGLGNCIVTGPHIEVSAPYIKQQIYEMAKLQDREQDVARLKEIYPDLEQSEQARHRLLAYILQELGLEVSDDDHVEEFRSWPIYVSAIDENDIFFLKDQFISNCVNEDGHKRVKDKETSWILLNSSLDASFLPNTETGVLFWNNEELEKFDIQKYQKFRKEYARESEVQFGNVLLYTPMIGSTQSTLDNNPWLSETLPSGSVVIASHQTAGRGRGKNSWISNQGCLQFSIRIEHASVKSVIFLQYLFGLAVVQAVSKLLGCGAIPIHLKWPNDIYVRIDNTLKKIGGILVTSEWVGESAMFKVTIGCGLNILNTKPSACLQDFTSESLAIEHVLACILAEFERLYQEMVNQLNTNDIFGIFRERYYKYWLHTNQKVQVQNQNGLQDMVIRGLDPSGYLKGKSSDGSIVLLQPDGNTFDMLKGLISVKNQNVF